MHVNKIYISYSVSYNKKLSNFMYPLVPMAPPIHQQTHYAYVEDISSSIQTVACIYV